MCRSSLQQKPATKVGLKSSVQPNGGLASWGVTCSVEQVQHATEEGASRSDNLTCMVKEADEGLQFFLEARCLPGPLTKEE